jgi:DNA uptake protein ComE-like DNA-binding protein
MVLSEKDCPEHSGQSFSYFYPAVKGHAMKDTWKDYFSFNKRQRNGLMVLVSLIAILIAYLFVSDYFPQHPATTDFTAFKSELGKAGIKSASATSSGNSSPGLIDINSADTSLLMTLPKMTSYCAGMVVRYRKKLGGYYSVNQLREVWGMDSAMFLAEHDKVRADTALLHKLNINTADIKALGYHPYIHYYLAKAIVNYREEHGLFASLPALHKMAAIDDSTYMKIAPYLTTGN